MSAFKRVIVIGPTKGTCVNLEILLKNDELPEPLPLLLREHHDELYDAMAHLEEGGFGIVANPGTGKSVAIGPICHHVLGPELRTGIVTMEHHVTEDTYECNVLVVTPGIAMQWAKSGKITAEDLIVIDEIHETSSHLELAMALLSFINCTFVWMSATINPVRYQEYLRSRTVITSTLRDPEREASVEYHYNITAERFMINQLPRVSEERRGMALFVPTRDEAETLARTYDSTYGVRVDFFHGGESADKLRPYVNGTVQRPFVIIMTPAGASSLNIAGLDSVAIVDSHYRTRIYDSREQLVIESLDPNTFLQMADRVDGRALGGEIHVITDNQKLNVRNLRPVTPEFVLEGNLEQLALISTKLDVDVRELPLIGPINHKAYGRVFDRLISRGLIHVMYGSPFLTMYGDRVAELPVSPAWGELIVRAEEKGDEELLYLVCLTACTSGVFSLTRKEWHAKSDPLVVHGSDHLTAYNILASALQNFGQYRGTRYSLRNNHGRFSDWCAENLYVMKEISGVILFLGSLMRRLQLAPEPTDFVVVDRHSTLKRRFIELLAEVQSQEYVFDHYHSSTKRFVLGNERRGVSYGKSVLGHIRDWKDRAGTLRSTIEGTEIPLTVVYEHSQRRILQLYGIAEDGYIAADIEMTFAGETLPVYRFDIPIEDISEDVLREHHQQELWQSWNPPGIPLPDLKDGTIVLPPLKTEVYGYDPLNNEPYVVYGTAILNPVRSVIEPFFTAQWFLSYEDAIAARADILGRATLPEEMLAHRRYVALIARAETLSERFLKLYHAGHAANPLLSEDIRRSIVHYAKPPSARSMEVYAAWNEKASEALVKVIAAINGSQTGSKENTSLRRAAEELRRQAKKLLKEHRAELADELLAQLRALAQQEFLPTATAELQTWMEEAKIIISQTEAAVAVSDEGEVPQESLNKLLSHFGHHGR